ncbi:hypothetical protein CLIB1423_39S00474 [[Candida] railenensis]|uniref:Uncharacterized protein n=1 Tax=[Candida] railenensis TaxID=45579 RepID=A0A9P0QVT7_9ASCO|nr:hypothetical protein CLIB1423_39S00474 [[Candida] railenensis]
MINMWLRNGESQHGQHGCSRRNEEAFTISCSPVAISQLDIYQKYSLRPQKEGYISRNCPAHYLSLLSNISNIDVKLDVYPEVVPDAILELSPFENIEASDVNIIENKDSIFADMHISEDPCEELKTSTRFNVEQVDTPLTHQYFENLFKTIKQSFNSVIKNFVLEAEICGEDESLTRANFNPKAKMLLYDNSEPIISSPSIIRVKRNNTLSSRLRNANGTTKSILKNKFNEFEENERSRAYQYDSLNIQEFMYELDYKEKRRVEESVLNPSLRQIQISRYNNGEFL